MSTAEILNNKKAVSPIVGVALMTLLTIIFAYAIGSSSIKVSYSHTQQDFQWAAGSIPESLKEK